MRDGFASFVSYGIVKEFGIERLDFKRSGIKNTKIAAKIKKNMNFFKFFVIFCNFSVCTFIISSIEYVVYNQKQTVITGFCAGYTYLFRQKMRLSFVFRGS